MFPGIEFPPTTVKKVIKRKKEFPKPFLTPFHSRGKGSEANERTHQKIKRKAPLEDLDIESLK